MKIVVKILEHDLLDLEGGPEKIDQGCVEKIFDQAGLEASQPSLEVLELLLAKLNLFGEALFLVLKRVALRLFFVPLLFQRLHVTLGLFQLRKKLRKFFLNLPGLRILMGPVFLEKIFVRILILLEVLVT
jgi:hypothetical protein